MMNTSLQAYAKTEDSAGASTDMRNAKWGANTLPSTYQQYEYLRVEPKLLYQLPVTPTTPRFASILFTALH